MEHGRAFHTVIDRDHRPHRALVEQLLTPHVVHCLKLKVYGVSDRSWRATVSCARTQFETHFDELASNFEQISNHP